MEIHRGMNIRKVIQRRIRHTGDGVDVAGDINAAISANVNEPGQSTHVSSKQTVVQRSGEPPVVETNVQGEEPDERA
jgi:hypothetical protein